MAVKIVLLFMLFMVCQSTLIVKPRSVLAKIGDRVTFHCRTDNTEYNIEWYRKINNNFDLIYDSNFVITRQYEIKGFLVGVDKNIGKSNLTIGSVIVDFAGVYSCDEVFEFFKFLEDALFYLIVLMEDPIVTSVVMEHEIQMNVTLRYRGEDTLFLIWDVKHRNGEHDIFPSKNDSYKDNGTESTFVYPLENVEKIRFQICGTNAGCFTKLYDGYTHQHRRQHHHSSAAAATAAAATAAAATTTTTTAATAAAATTTKITTSATTTTITTSHIPKFDHNDSNVLKYKICLLLLFITLL